MTAEQTPQAFIQRLKPSLSFTGPTDEPPGIPPGLLSCCRVVHQVDCDHHVARTLIGAFHTRVWPDGREEEWIHPHPVDMEGDALATPTMLFAAVRAHWALAGQTAAELGAEVKTMTVAVYSLNTTDAALFTAATNWYYERLAERYLDEGNALSAEQIARMPVEILPDEPEEVARLLALPSWVPAAAYAGDVLIYPGEVGHDVVARYIGSPILPNQKREAMPFIEDPDPFPKEEATA